MITKEGYELKKIISRTAMMLAALVCSHVVPVHASQSLNHNTDLLLQSPIILNRAIPKEMYIFEEAQMFASVSPVPISIEQLTDRKHPLRMLNHSVPAGNYTVQSALDDLTSQGSLVTWIVVDKSVFIIIRTAPDLADPLDIKLNQAYRNDLTLNEWVDWVDKQAPITGAYLDSPDASRDMKKIRCDINTGSTIRSVFAAISHQTSGEWLFNIQKNNYYTDAPLPYTDAENKYLDSPAAGNQLGRTQVYYYPASIFHVTDKNR